MKTITKRDYEEIVFLKNISDHLQEEREELYQRVKKILYVTDDNWVTDYFDNDSISFLELISHYGIELQK